MKPQHGEIKILRQEECFELLKRSSFGHLSCYTDELYLVPFTFFFNDGFIYSHSKIGKKIEMMRENPKICFQVEEVEDFLKWKSVIAWGKFSELEGDEAAIAMRRLIQDFASSNSGERSSQLEVDFSAQVERSIIFRIKIEKVSGRAEGY